jgi:hypothetical protein
MTSVRCDDERLVGLEVPHEHGGIGWRDMVVSCSTLVEMSTRERWLHDLVDRPRDDVGVAEQRVVEVRLVDDPTSRRSCVIEICEKSCSRIRRTAPDRLGGLTLALARSLTPPASQPSCRPSRGTLPAHPLVVEHLAE